MNDSKMRRDVDLIAIRRKVVVDMDETHLCQTGFCLPRGRYVCFVPET